MDITAVTATVSTVVNNQTQSSLLAIRLAAESQRQMAALLAQSVGVAASNPEHLGKRIDTYA